MVRRWEELKCEVEVEVEVRPFLKMLIWRLEMSDTALIDEVRATRHRIAEECGHDIMKIIEHAENAAKELGRRENAA